MSRAEYARRLLLAAGAAVGVVLVVRGIAQLAHVSLLLFTSVLIAVVVHGFAERMGRSFRLPHTVAVALAFVLSLGVISGAAWWSGPQMGEQFGELVERVPEIARDLTAQIESTAWGGAILDRMGRPADALPRGQQALGRVTRMFSTAGGVLTSVVVTLFMALYLSLDPAAYRRSVVRLAPDGAWRDRLTDVLDAAAHALRLWMKARLLSMAIVGIMTWTGLTVAGIPLAFALALTAAVLAFIPFIGPILAAVPAVLIGLGESGQAALVVLAIYLGVQAIESYLITPIIEQRVVSLPPAFVLAAQLVFGSLFGLMGVFLATPIAVTVVVLVRRLYLDEVLGQELEPLGP